LVRYDVFKGVSEMTVKKFYPSLIPLIRDDLLRMIETDDYNGFQKKCENTFHYSPLPDPELTSSICVDYPHLEQRKILEIKQRNYRSTTVIEALFNDKHSNACKDVIDLILKKDDGNRWCAILWGVFHKSGLSLTDKLYEWDTEMEDHILETLEVMQDYAHKLFDNYSDLSERKYTAISTTVYELKKAIESEDNPLRGPLSEVEEPQKWFLNLSFKLSLRKRLYEDDYLLSEHRGYTRLMVNLISLLFTFGTANLVNKLSTGDWLFFNKTTTMQKVEQAEESLSLTSR
jgi:hypothetical protein